MAQRIRRALIVTTPLLAVLQGCEGRGSSEWADPTEPPAALPERVERGDVVFGFRVGLLTHARGLELGASPEVDFVLHALEGGPAQPGRISAFLEGLRQGASQRPESPPLLLVQVPALHRDSAATRAHVIEALAAGAAGVAYPAVGSSVEAALTVVYLGAPEQPGVAPLDVVIVEDRSGVADIRAIAATPGLSIVLVDADGLRRAYATDPQAADHAIRSVRSACREFGVPCGITAGADEVATRLDEGFQMILVADERALRVGRRHLESSAFRSRTRGAESQDRGIDPIGLDP